MATAVNDVGTGGGDLLGLAVSDGTVLFSQFAPRGCGVVAMSCDGLIQVVLLGALSLSYAFNVMFNCNVCSRSSWYLLEKLVFS